MKRDRGLRAPVEREPNGEILIGWKEYLDLPDLGIHRLKAKIDTGARTSTLHVDAVTVVERLASGGEVAELSLGPDPVDPARRLTTRAVILDRVSVTDSGGHPEERPRIETTLMLGPVRKPILLTLTDRSEMLFRMILGRTALAGDFRVDVARKYVLRRWHPVQRRGRS
jgi:hypothetical protein